MKPPLAAVVDKGVAGMAADTGAAVVVGMTTAGAAVGTFMTSSIIPTTHLMKIIRPILAGAGFASQHAMACGGGEYGCAEGLSCLGISDCGDFSSEKAYHPASWTRHAMWY
ncbi:MAG: hypothetical protein ACXV3D_08090 [Halobacteriota archaeon]